MPSQREERGNQGLTKAFSMNVAKLLMLSLEESFLGMELDSLKES